MSIDYEPMSSKNWRDPYPVYRQLRDEAPLHQAPGSGTWCLSRHADVVAALRQPEIFSSVAMEKILMIGSSRLGARDLPALLRFAFRARVNPFRNPGPPPGLINSDPPFHDALRDVVNRGFTPRRIAAWEPRMREIAQERIQGLRGGGPFDVVRDLAIPLPVTVIAEILGVEAERQHDFKRWSDSIVSFTSGTTRGGGMAGILDPMGECRNYVRGVVRARREQPADDLISLLVDPAREDTLDEAEVFGLIILLLVAGNETTTNLIGNTTLALLEHPETLERVAAAPSLVPALVEETLRWDSPVQLIFRETTREVELPSGKIPAGASVALLLGAANRDERVFEAGERFDIDRNPAGHVGFGFGVHFCLGASLARLEALVALETLIPELPHRRASEAQPPLVDSFLVRGPSRLQLVAAH
ncbi:MAG: cytochrome P450 [Myxococcota bacterium]